MMHSLIAFALLVVGHAAADHAPSRPVLSTYRGGGSPPLTSLVKGPAEMYAAFAEKGASNANLDADKILFQSFMGGAYIGFGGLLALIVSSGATALKLANPSLGKMIFAALFPVNLLIILLTGGQLFTGNTAAVTSAVCEGLTTRRQLATSWLLSYAGNVLGCVLFAYLTAAAGFLTGATADGAAELAVKKVGASFMQTVLKAFLCNWLVCIAVLLCGAAQDMAGKMVAIWFPISTFVAIGCEHSVANLYLLPLGLLAGAPLSLGDVIIKNILPVTIGNAIAGVVMVGMGYSYAFGKLGKKKQRAMMPVTSASTLSSY